MLNDKHIFKWVPLAETSTSRKPRIRRVSFGDGYEQRSKDGLNSNLAPISLKFDGMDREMDLLEQFLKDRAGVESFYYAHKFGENKLYVCEEWNRMDIDGLSSEISATFREVVN